MTSNRQHQRIAILGARLIDAASGLDEQQALYIDNGLIRAIGAPPAGFVADLLLDVPGQIVCAGLVDLRARLEPAEDSNASVASEVRAAVAGGITSLACMPDNYPTTDARAAVHLLLGKAREQGLARVLPLGALTRNLAGEQLSEMARLGMAGCHLLTNGNAPLSSLIMRRAMEYASTFGLGIMTFAEDPSLAGNGCVHEGSTGLKLGLQAIPVTAEEIGISRDIALAELTGCKVHFAAVSSARGVALIADGRNRGLALTADVAVHHLHLNDTAILQYGSLCHLRPPLRSETDRLALIEGLKNGVLDALCSDHLPCGEDAKMAPFPASKAGAAGLELLLPLALQLVKEHGISLSAMLAAMTARPSAILGLPTQEIRVGEVADLAIFDPQRTWQPALDGWHSLGKNTPFYRQSLTGRVTHTLVGGQLVYRLGDQGGEFDPRSGP